MNRLRNAVRLRRRGSSEMVGGKVIGESGLQVGNVESIGIVGKENSSGAKVPEILSHFPDLYVESSTGIPASGGIGQMICGTISSYFEDTWNKTMGEMKQSRSRSVSSFSCDLGLGVHLVREWHRLWLVRSFLAFAWESYLEDLITLSEQLSRDYLTLPSYGSGLDDVGKIPLGEILCIVTSSKMASSEKSSPSIPFSTIQGKMIIKKSLSLNSKIHWKTPPPNTVAKFHIFQDQKRIFKQSVTHVESGDSFYISLNVDNPGVLWKNSFLDLTPKEFQDLQILASSIRVLRKDETAKFTLDGKKSLVIKLLHWYRETKQLIDYGGRSVECRYFIVKEDFRLVAPQMHGKAISVEYYITSDDSKKRRLFSGQTYISNGSYSSPMMEAVMRGNGKVVIYMNKELAQFELGVLRRHSENSKFANCLGSILTGMSSGKTYFLHLEIPSIEREVQDFQKREHEKALLFRHILQSRRHFEGRLQILRDLKSFGYLVASTLSLRDGESVVVENIYIKEIGYDPILLEELKVKLESHLLGNNLFEVPFVMFEFEGHTRAHTQVFMVSPCIRNYNELLFYSHFGWLNREHIRGRKFRIHPNENYSRRIFGATGEIVKHDSERIEQFQMGISHYAKGVSLLIELGDFYFYLDEGIIDDLRDNRSIYFLEEEFELLSKGSEGGLPLYFHVLRTCFYIFNESYGEGVSDLNQESLYTLKAHAKEWSSSLRFPKLRELLRLETKKRAGSVYFNIIGLLAQLLLEIHLEERVQGRLVEDLLNKVRESMRHASIQVILLDYLVTWILFNVSIFRVCKKDLPLNVGAGFQNILIYHRICRQFLQSKDNQVPVQRGVSCGKFTLSGVLNSTLPMTIISIREEEKNREGFFQHLTRFYIFEKMSQLLVSPADVNGHMDENLSYFNLLRDEPVLEFLSIGQNKSGILGLGPPRVQLFSDLECNLYPRLIDFNRMYSMSGVEEDRSKCIQKVVVPDESFLLKGIAAIAYGADHMVVLGKEGGILTWGGNSSGQCCQEKRQVDRVDLGDRVDGDFKGLIKRIEDHVNIVPYPLQKFCFSSLHERIPICKVECGAYFTLALDSNGSLFSWGQGRDGCLGTGSYDDSFVPHRIEMEGRVKSFSAGMFHSAAIDEESRLFVWGSNEFGQLGTDLYTDDKSLNRPLRISVGLSRAGERSSRVTITSLRQDLEGGVKWKSVSLGEAHSIALDTEGVVWVWGQNNLKQLTAVPEMLETEFILEHGRVSSDYYRRLGSQVIFPTPLVSTERMAVFESRKIGMIFSGGAACCAIDQEGKPWIWGLSFVGIDHHSSTSIFSRRQGPRAGDHGGLREFELPTRVFRNITPDDDSIRMVRFGKGNNNISMISRLGRCYLWLENKELVTDQMRYSNTHNCFILENLQIMGIRDNQSNSSWYRSILDVALLSDSI
ncbi:RCC1 domain-containing protein, partial [Cryptosporidium canis]